MKNPADFTMDELVGQFVQLRDARADFEKTRVECQEVMDKIGKEIKKRADAQEVESFATIHGTAFKSKKDWVRPMKEEPGKPSWDDALSFIIKNDLKHLLTRSVKKAAAKEYMAENNNLLPPGLEYGDKVEINVVRRK